MAHCNLPRLFRIAVLECLRLPDDVSRTRGQFGDVFKCWLSTALESYNSERQRGHQIQLKFSSWDVEHGQYPPNLEDIDALFITGSTASAYDVEPWIIKLGDYLSEVYSKKPKIRLFGGCFGHQLLSRVLLGMHGTRVEKSPNGWEIGVHDVKLNPEFRDQFSILSSVSSMACQYLHADHVVLDKKCLPENWVTMGASESCDVQGLYHLNRVLTFQGHPEFDQLLNGAVVKSLGKNGVLSQRELEDAMQKIQFGDDSLLYGKVLLEFIAGNK